MNNEVSQKSEIFKRDIIIAGVGGQGIVSIASVIGYATLEAHLFFKQSEVHGMSQRGGDVQSHFRIANFPVHSDTVPLGQADLIISVEPLEALRYVNYLSPEGWIIANTTPFENVPNYPDLGLVHSTIENFTNSMLFNADEEARKIGTVKAANMVLLGAASAFLGLEYSTLENGIKKLFGRKGEKVVDMNLRALARGKELYEQIKK
jgi:indolepyruvate ferredoxin oxidoreductase beta subunit